MEQIVDFHEFSLPLHQVPPGNLFFFIESTRKENLGKIFPQLFDNLQYFTFPEAAPPKANKQQIKNEKFHDVLALVFQ